MPEGDSIHYAAKRIAAVLGGTVPERIATPHPRIAAADELPFIIEIAAWQAARCTRSTRWASICSSASTAA